jgi:hypothetical protein
MRPGRYLVIKPCAWGLAAALLAAGLARADAVDACESAFNQGTNTSAYFVSMVFARTVRGTQSRLAAHAGVDKMLSVYAGRRPYDDEVLALCHQRGLWTGLVGRLSTEYARAGGSGEFACLDRALLSRHAATQLRGMASWTDLTSLRDDVLGIFADEPGKPGVPWCEPLALEACTSVLAADAYAPFVEPVAAELCEPPLETSADAGVDAAVQ